MMNRAFSLLEIKRADDDARTITGIATTPTADRMNDIVEPEGAQFKLPITLLWQHDSAQPIGDVTHARVTKAGIEITAKIARILEPGRLKDRIDEAWQTLKAGLVRGLSIGFTPVEKSYIPETKGFRFSKWNFLELSCVTIPANQEATIQTVKSLDTAQRAASGRNVLHRVVHLNPPGASGSAMPQEGAMKTIAEQITALEAKRMASAARMEAVMAKTLEEDRTSDAAESEEFDTLNAEVEAIDKDLVRLRAVEKAKALAARPVIKADTTREGAAARSSIIVRQPKLPAGTLFTRWAMAVAAGKGSFSDTLQYAQRWESQTPEVGAYIKAVAGSTGDGQGSSSTGEWGAELVYPTNLVSEFIELLRPATIIGRINGMRQVPFNVRIPGVQSGSTVNWVGESAVKPVGEMEFMTLLLPYHKVAGIIVLTEELIRLSSPSAEATVRNELVSQCAQFLDEQFVDPAITATDNRPASITNGVTPTPASGTTAEDLYYDLNTALATFDDAEMSHSSIHLLMPVALARGMSALRNPLGQFEFSSVTPNGGTLMGYPIIVSNSVPDGTIVIVSANDILLADDGKVTLDASNQATLDMAGGAAPTFNLWQRNCVGIRAERWITYKKRRSTAVAMITGAAYSPQPSATA